MAVPAVGQTAAAHMAQTAALAVSSFNYQSFFFVLQGEMCNSDERLGFVYVSFIYLHLLGCFVADRAASDLFHRDWLAQREAVFCSLWTG